MRGGYRGGGRPKGSKDKQPRKRREDFAPPKPTDHDVTQQMVDLGKKARKKIYQEFLLRVANKDKNGNPLNLPPLTIAEKRLMDKIGAELEAEIRPEAPKHPAEGKNLEAHEYLRQVWNDPTIEPALRIRAAEIAFKGPEGKLGKKDEKADRAKAAGAGKYAPSKPPLALVK